MNKKRTVVNQYYMKTLSIQTDSKAGIISQSGFKPVEINSAIMEEFLELYDFTPVAQIEECTSTTSL